MTQAFGPLFIIERSAEKVWEILDAAEKDFKKAIALNNTSYEPYIELGEIYQSRQQFYNAKVAYQSAEDLVPNSPLPLYMLGSLALSKNELMRAQNNFEKCIKIDARFAPAYVSLGILRLRTEKKDLDKNLELFNKAIQADSTFKPSYFWHGMIYAKYGQNEKALKDFNKLILLIPDNPLVLFIRGFILIELDRYDDAFKDVRKAVMSRESDQLNYMTGETVLNKNLDLKNAAAYLVRTGFGLKEETFDLIKKSFCLIVISKDYEASTSLQLANKIESNAPSYLLMGLIWERMKRYDSARVNFDKAIKLDNDLYLAHKKRAFYRFDENNLKGAHEDLMAMKRIEPETTSTYRISGLLKSSMKDYYGCVIDLSTVIKRDSGDAKAWATRAYCRSQVEDYKGSTEDYRQALVLEPEVPDYYYEILKNHLNLSDTLAGLTILRKMQSVWPDDPAVTLETADVFLALKNYDSASILLDIIKKRSTTAYMPSYQPYLLFLQGKLLVSRSDLEKGIKKIEQSLKLDNRNTDRIFYLVKIYLQANRVKDARKEMELLRSLNYLPAKPYYEKYLSKQ